MSNLTEISDEMVLGVKENLENLMDMDLNSDYIVRQIIKACLSPIINDRVGIQEIEKVLGDEFSLGIAKREFQGVVTSYTKRYLCRMLGSIQESLEYPDMVQITNRTSGKIGPYKEYVTEKKNPLVDVNIFECEMDLGCMADPIVRGSMTEEVRSGYAEPKKRDVVKVSDEDEEPDFSGANSDALDGSRFTGVTYSCIPDVELDLD